METGYRQALSSVNLNDIRMYYKNINNIIIDDIGYNDSIISYTVFGDQSSLRKNDDYQGLILRGYNETSIFCDTFITITFTENKKGSIKTFLNEDHENTVFSFKTMEGNRQGDMLNSTEYENFCLLSFNYPNQNSDAVLYQALFAPLRLTEKGEKVG